MPAWKSFGYSQDGQRINDFRVLRSGHAIVLPGVERAIILDQQPKTAFVVCPLPHNFIGGRTLYLRADLRFQIAEDDNSIKIAALHFQGLNKVKTIEKMTRHLATHPLKIEALPDDLTELGTGTISGEQANNLWKVALSPLGLQAVSYNFIGITYSEKQLPTAPSKNQNNLSHLANLLDFKTRSESLEVVIKNPTCPDNQICVTFSLAVQVGANSEKLANAANTFLGKDADEVKAIISNAIACVTDDAIESSGLYALFVRLEEDGKKIGLSDAQNQQEFAMALLNAIAEQSLSWRGKLSLSRNVWTAIKATVKLNATFSRNIHSAFSNLGLDLKEIDYAGVELRNRNRTQGDDETSKGTVLQLAEKQVSIQIETRFPIPVIGKQMALLSAIVCLRVRDKNRFFLQDRQGDLQSMLSKSFEAALDNNKVHSFFNCIKHTLYELGIEEVNLANLNASLSYESVVERMGVAPIILKLAKVLLSGLEAYGETRHKFMTISENDLHKHNLYVHSFSITDLKEV